MLTIVPSLLVPFLIGITLLATKDLNIKTKKTLAIILLITGILNLLVASIVLIQGNIKRADIVGLILYFLLGIVPVIIGLMMLKTKEITKKIKEIYGIILLGLVIIYFLFINFYNVIGLV
ncbi:hypothetical protein KY348_07805 [Candidatus Woesearchaeota archaeon]|nr:hypothetical protein [Candidatus Woesearchaeota archaeon]